MHSFCPWPFDILARLFTSEQKKQGKCSELTAFRRTNERIVKVTYVLVLWLWLVHTHAMEPNELEWLYFIQIVCVGAIFSILCYLWVNRRCLLFEVHFFVRSQRFFCTVFIFLGWCAMCVWLIHAKHFRLHGKYFETFSVSRFILSHSIIFFSFLTRQRVFFSRYNNTTIGFDGFSLLLVYVCGSLVVSFPTFKQHQLKIFFQLSVFMFQAKHFISKHFINNVLWSTKLQWNGIFGYSNWNLLFSVLFINHWISINAITNNHSDELIISKLLDYSKANDLHFFNWKSNKPKWSAN